MSVGPVSERGSILVEGTSKRRNAASIADGASLGQAVVRAFPGEISRVGLRDH